MDYFKITMKVVALDSQENEFKSTKVIYAEANSYMEAELEGTEYISQTFIRGVISTITKTKVVGVSYLEKDVVDTYYQVKTVTTDLETERELSTLRLVNASSLLKVATIMSGVMDENEELREVIATTAIDVIEPKE